MNFTYTNEGEDSVSTTYPEAQRQLCVENKGKAEDVVFSFYDLDRTPDEIPRFCNDFLEK